MPRTAFAQDGFRQWALSDAFPSGLRAVFVQGEVLLEMSPEEIETHNKVKGEITAALIRFVKAGDLGEVFSDGVLLTNAEAGLSCEPDLTFVSWASFEAERVQLAQKAGQTDRYVELQGRPDLVLEVISDSSVRKDKHVLRDAYRRAGVVEYWLVDARSDVLRFEILVNRAGGFVPSAPSGEAQTSDVLGCAWVLSRSRNRAGRFSYQLNVV